MKSVDSRESARRAILKSIAAGTSNDQFLEQKLEAFRDLSLPMAGVKILLAENKPMDAVRYMIDHCCNNACVWLQVLTTIAQSIDNRPAVIEFVRCHSIYNVVPWSTVLQILSDSPVKWEFGIVKEAVLNTISKDYGEMVQIKEDVDRIDEQCKHLRQRLRSLDKEPRVFQATTCAICTGGLCMPNTHRMCGHSFHQLCFATHVEQNGATCPVCKPKSAIADEVSVSDRSSILSRSQLNQLDLRNKEAE